MIEIILLWIASLGMFFLLGLKIINYYFYLEDKKKIKETKKIIEVTISLKEIREANPGNIKSLEISGDKILIKIEKYKSK